MSENLTHEVLILAFGELPDDEWEQAVDREEALLSAKLNEELNQWAAGSTKALNIGRGADWLVLGFYFLMAGLAIPEAHKKVRENIEEWQRIYSELYGLFSRVIGKRKALYPDAYLFLVAVQYLAERVEIGDVEYKSTCRIPEANPDLVTREPLLFSFGTKWFLIQIAVGRDGKVLWTNQLDL